MKVHYALGLLEGNALEYMRPWMQANRDTESFKITLFVEHLRAAYLNLELAEYARQRLAIIKQGNRPVL